MPYDSMGQPIGAYGSGNNMGPTNAFYGGGQGVNNNSMDSGFGYGIAGIGAGAGALAGGLGSNSSQQQINTVNANVSSLGANANAETQQSLTALRNLTNDQASVNRYAPLQYSQLLQHLIQTGGLPDQGQIGQANQYAQNIFAPQQAALNNTFYNAQQNTNRQAASLGRSVDDPILQAKLAQYQGQQQGVLSGQQGAFASQMALQLPQQQLGYAQQLSNQALQNQQIMAGLGNQLFTTQSNYALATAGRNTQNNAQSGGGLGGALLGGISGIGGGLQAANYLGAFKSSPNPNVPEGGGYYSDPSTFSGAGNGVQAGSDFGTVGVDALGEGGGAATGAAAGASAGAVGEESASIAEILAGAFA